MCIRFNLPRPPYKWLYAFYAFPPIEIKHILVSIVSANVISISIYFVQNQVGLHSQKTNAQESQASPCSVWRHSSPIGPNKLRYDHVTAVDSMKLHQQLM